MVVFVSVRAFPPLAQKLQFERSGFHFAPRLSLPVRRYAFSTETAALEDPNTGVVSWESGAIMNYIRRVYDKQNKIGPRGSTEQDIVDFEKWEYFLLTTLGPMTGQTNWVRVTNISVFIPPRYLSKILTAYFASMLCISSSATTIPPRMKTPSPATQPRHTDVMKFSKVNSPRAEARAFFQQDTQP